LIGRRRERTVRNAVQQPLVFQDNVAYQSQGSLGLSIGTVVEMIGGDGVDDTPGRLDFVGKVGSEKVCDRSRVVGIQFIGVPTWTMSASPDRAVSWKERARVD
jgi:hypothetical protein